MLSPTFACPRAKPAVAVIPARSGGLSSIAFVLLLSAIMIANPYALRAEEPASGAQSEASEASASLIDPGNVAVTGFSGTSLSKGSLPPGVNPIDETFINTEGPSLKLLDVSNLGTAGTGSAAEVPSILSVKAREIGQVFGVSVHKFSDDEPAHIYAAATSVYGLQIVAEADGNKIRLVKGEPGAKWMAGQFGTEKGGGPGSIWEIDGTTGEVNLFADITSGANENSGASLGALAFDPVSKHIYVPNLETGYIHEVDAQGQTVGLFDHGVDGRAKAGLKPVPYDVSSRVSIDHPSFNVEDPSTWGFTDDKRLVFGVAVHDGRLYYSVAEGPQIWSVGLNSAGGFAEDARVEIDLNGQTAGNMVTGIAFDDHGDIYLAQRGKIAASYDYGTLASPQESSVLQFSYDEEAQSWSKVEKEFAVSERAPYRASNGGVALGYGYNKNGTIKQSSCRATLWVTGDNLNKPKAGPTVNGLQAMRKSAGQARAEVVSGQLPQLDPPSKAWMIDFDGESLGDDAYGHVGALAVYAPGCEGAADEERPDVVADAEGGPGEGFEPDYAWPDVDPEFIPPGGFPPGPILPPPGAGTQGLDIAKSCAPSAIGGQVKCTITVENTGTLPLADPIVVSDDTIIAAGPGSGGSLQVANVTPDGPEWTCTATPTVNLSCGILPEHVPPGTSREFVVDIDTSTMLADGNVGFSNCASLGAPYVGVACDNGGTDISVKKIAKNPFCNPLLPCPFTIEITNNSTQDFNGQLQLTDTAFMTAGGGSLAGPITVTGDLGCAGGNPAAIPFTCQSTMQLAAGETRSIDIDVTMPPAPPNNYWVRNCFMVTEPGNIPSPTTLADVLAGGAVGGTLGTGGAMGCAWAQVGAPPPVSNLKVVKTSTGKCGKDPADPNNVKCDYNIAITNTGPADFNNTINILEKADLTSATVVSNDPTWTVTGPAPPGSFSLNPAGGGAVSIPADPANNTITIPVSLVVPKTDVETVATACQVGNTATILSPVWPPDNSNYNPTDDSASVSGDASLLEFDGGGAAIILCDPTNLQTKKVANGPCKKSGNKWRCDYTVFVENMGPDPYKGNIVVEDTLEIGAVSISQSGAQWGKMPISPTTNQFIYLGSNWPGGTMGVGQKAELNLTVEVPDGEYCSLKNTARMTFPTESRHNQNTDDDEDDATAQIPRPECKKAPQCRPGKNEFRTESGACACRKNFTRSSEGTCVPDEPERESEPEEHANFDDLRVRKTGPKECHPDDDSCVFEVTVANGGKETFSGKAAIVDGITASGGSVLNGARIVSIEPPLGCDTEPTRLPFGCQANLELGPGQSVTHRVTVRLPDDAAKNGPVTMKNCAMVNMPDVLDADVNKTVGGASGNRSTPASRRTSCHEFNVVEEEEEPTQCTNGMELNNEGRCECPSGTSWNGRKCFEETTEPGGQTLTPLTPTADEPVCPEGWDRFNEFRGKPLGYHLQNVTSNGETIICGEPRCEAGWKVYQSSSSIPRGWRSKHIGRANSKYKFWCARPPESCTPGRHEIKYKGQCICRDGYQRDNNGACVREEPPPHEPPPPLPPETEGVHCWYGWIQIARSQQSAYRAKNYIVKARRRGGEVAYCALPRSGPPTPPPRSCKPGRNEIKVNGECVCREGYSRNNNGVCASSENPSPPCWKGWRQISASQISAYRRKGFYIRKRGSRRRATICARPRPDSAGNGSNSSVAPGAGSNSNAGTDTNNGGGTSVGCRGGTPFRNTRTGRTTCWCPKGKTAVRIGRNRFECRGSTSGSGQSTGTGGSPAPCPRPRYLNRRGVCTCGPKKRWTGKTCRPVGTTGNGQNTGGNGGKPPCYGGTLSNQFEFGWVCTCPKGTKKVPIGKSGGGRCLGGSNPNNNSTTRTCADIGKFGKWPKCHDKVVRTCKELGKLGKWPNCRNRPQKTCQQIGKLGKWPNCRNRPQKTCQQIGKLGKWPNCRNRPRKTCQQIGKLGKWPNCRNRPRKTCQQIGKLGKWPNCRNRPRKTCQQIGKLGKWPNCRNRPQKTCRQIGKVGKWPNCRNKPRMTCAKVGKVGKWPNCKARRNKRKPKLPNFKQNNRKKKVPKRSGGQKKMSCHVLGMKGRWPNCKPK